jgi:hypothetical protein
MRLRGCATLLIATAICPILPHPANAQTTDAPHKVIFDQDTDGIIGDNEDPLVMLLQSPNIQVLGVTVVTGNGWLKQETADVLKLLEDLHRTDVPVYMGAEFPLVQSRFTPARLVKMYGGTRTDPFLGAYGEFSPGPDVVKPPAGGMPTTKPAPEIDDYHRRHRGEGA